MNKKALYESIMKNIAKSLEINESNHLNEGAGWDKDEFYDLLEILSKCYDLDYEIKNCIRGGLTNCNTYKDIAKYLETLSRQLNEQASYFRTLEGPDEYSEDEEI